LIFSLMPKKMLGTVGLIAATVFAINQIPFLTKFFYSKPAVVA